MAVNLTLMYSSPFLNELIPEIVLFVIKYVD